MDAVATVELEVRELIRRRGIDPVADVAGARAVVQEAVADYDERAMSGGLPTLGDHVLSAKVHPHGTGDDQDAARPGSRLVDMTAMAAALPLGRAGRTRR